VKNFKWWQWILIIIAIGIVFYIIYPKYYFTDNGRARCNRITGVVDVVSFFGDWERIGKENLFIRLIEKIKLIFESKEEKKKRKMRENLGSLRSALIIYYGEHEGFYPKSLQDLAPKYIGKIPYPEEEWIYNPQTGDVYSQSYGY